MHYARYWINHLATSPNLRPSPPRKKLGFERIAQVDLESPGEQFLQMLQCSYATDYSSANTNNNAIYLVVASNL